MAKSVIGEFKVEYSQTLDENGTVDQSLMPQLSEDQIKEMYHLMRLVRTMDEKLFTLQRSGKIGTYAQVKGQEASEIGSGFALEENDWFVPSFRELGVAIARGADRAKLVQAWKGDLRAFEGIEQTKSLPVAIPIASQCLHAAGIAWASQIKGEKSATIVYFGDGATSEGDFHEAMNFASVFNLPVVFFCQNNQWAISTPRDHQTHSQSIAQKAIAYGMPGYQIDGNDVLGVYRVTKDALDRARNGEGPTLIESITFRQGDHTTSDDSHKYRTEEVENTWKQKDPLVRLEKYFQQIGTWSEDYNNFVSATVEKEVAEAVDAGLSVSPPPAEDLFRHIFAELPEHLAKQQKELQKEITAGLHKDMNPKSDGGAK